MRIKEDFQLEKILNKKGQRVRCARTHAGRTLSLSLSLSYYIEKWAGMHYTKCDFIWANRA